MLLFSNCQNSVVYHLAVPKDTVNIKDAPCAITSCTPR